MLQVRGEELDHSYNGEGPRKIQYRSMRRVRFWKICRTMLGFYLCGFKVFDNLTGYRS